MSKYAFIDYDRKLRISASQALEKGLDNRYYCPNPCCDAYMHIIQARNPYFSANIKGHGHTDNCFYANSLVYDEGKYDESRFDLDVAMAYILGINNYSIDNGGLRNHKNGVKGMTPIKTLRVLYEMCKMHNINDSYNNIPISSLIFDNRSQLLVNHNIQGFRIIETVTSSDYFFKYDCKNATIELSGPANDPRQGFKFVVGFQYRGVYEKVQNLIYNNRRCLFAVAGKWEWCPELNAFFSEGYNDRQVIIV